MTEPRLLLVPIRRPSELSVSHSTRRSFLPSTTHNPSGPSPPPLLLAATMSYPQQRPARHSRPQPPSYAAQQPYAHPTLPPPSTSPPPGAYYGQQPLSPRSGYPNITFQDAERGDRQGSLDGPRQRTMPSPYQNQFSPPHPDVETADFLEQAGVGRKKSLVRPDREKIEPGHRQWHYRSRVEQMADDARVGVQPSCMSTFGQRGYHSLKSYRGSSHWKLSPEAPPWQIVACPGGRCTGVGPRTLQAWCYSTPKASTVHPVYRSFDGTGR